MRPSSRPTGWSGSGRTHRIPEAAPPPEGAAACGAAYPDGSDWCATSPLKAVDFCDDFDIEGAPTANWLASGNATQFTFTDAGCPPSLPFGLATRSVSTSQGSAVVYKNISVGANTVTFEFGFDVRFTAKDLTSGPAVGFAAIGFGALARATLFLASSSPNEGLDLQNFYMDASSGDNAAATTHKPRTNGSWDERHQLVVIEGPDRYHGRRAHRRGIGPRRGPAAFRSTPAWPTALTVSLGSFESTSLAAEFDFDNVLVDHQ